MEILRYVSRTGRIVVNDWLAGLHDPKTSVKITMRISRLAQGNFGDCKPLREGVWELRINWGPGYRLYYAKIGSVCLLLLCGGDKRAQTADIGRAVEYLKDYQRRIRKP